MLRFISAFQTDSKTLYGTIEDLQGTINKTSDTIETITEKVEDVKDTYTNAKEKIDDANLQGVVSSAPNEWTDAQKIGVGVGVAVAALIVICLLFKFIPCLKCCF